MRAANPARRDVNAKGTAGEPVRFAICSIEVSNPARWDADRQETKGMPARRYVKLMSCKDLISLNLKICSMRASNYN